MDLKGEYIYMKCEWIDFTLLWVLKNQYCASTGVAPSGGV